MAVKKYRAKNLFEAFAMIREDFGLNATILETREIPTRRFFGLISGASCVEVTACDEENSEEAEPVSEVHTQTAVLEPPKPALSGFGGSGPVSFWDSIQTEPPRTSASDDSGLLFGSGEGFFRQIANLEKDEKGPVSGKFRDALFQIYSKLQTADMDENSISELMKRLREDELLYSAAGKRNSSSDFAFLERKLQQLVAEEIRTAGPIRVTPGKRHTVALVGPTGVGKTTTIAKLAIDYRQKKNCQVGLITLDLSRMGAVEQLQTFADVIGIPMLCAATRRQMKDAIERMADFDLVLIDTAGQSRAGEMTLQEMHVLFEAAQVDETMLVLASTARSRLLTKTVQSFAPIGVTSLVLTKLDEALGLGNLYPLLQSTTLPISYLTNGQKVPDDFEPAERTRLAKYILGDEV
ncbi:MAG: flagellar biosynthesis protein FlhF [Thermoguttaceae bacterium]|nr:flagellar biosynthesis protein FlhF [Thermoguttaceae bacterium]